MVSAGEAHTIRWVSDSGGRGLSESERRIRAAGGRNPLFSGGLHLSLRADAGYGLRAGVRRRGVCRGSEPRQISSFASVFRAGDPPIEEGVLLKGLADALRGRRFTLL
jgi:hypothetical protein